MKLELSCCTLGVASLDPKPCSQTSSPDFISQSWRTGLQDRIWAEAWEQGYSGSWFKY